MHKKDLVATIAGELNMTKASVYRVIGLFERHLTDIIVSGDKYSIPGIATLQRSVSAPISGVINGQAYKKPKISVSCHSSKVIRRKIAKAL